MWRGFGTTSRCRSVRYYRSCGSGPPSTHPAPALPNDVRVCPAPGIVTAAPAPRVIPKSPLGVSVWTRVLLDKYLYSRPTHRLCQELEHHGLHLSPGTITDG